jgi:RNA polymerase subunit RPABC4/transcription elongation factor Spt4
MSESPKRKETKKQREKREAREAEARKRAIFNEKLYQVEISPQIYTWCLHCETVHASEKWQDKCPNCGAYEFTDGWHWGKLVLFNGYPETPEEGKEYPLYPES